MRVYRYTVEGHGFLTAADEYFDIQDIFCIDWIFTAKLPQPKINMNNTISYFTERGNKTFHKAIKAYKKLYKNKGVEMICTISEINEEDILYQDIYQVVLIDWNSDQDKNAA